MATTQRRPRPALIEQLLAAPHRFEFFQAVRLLGNAAPERAGSAVHFSGNHQMHFAAADIDAVTALSAEDENDEAAPLWSMRVNLLTLTGSAGVLPHHYSELLLQRMRARDDTLRDFFDLFNERSIALLFQSWEKYRLPFLYERHRREQRRERDPITQVLSALVGIGTPQLSERLPLSNEAMIGGGMFARLIKSATALENLLRQYLGLDIKVEQFQGQWQELPEDLRTRLPDGSLAAGAGGLGMNNSLGINALLGAHCWQIQSKFRVRIRKLGYARLMELEPGGERMHNLVALTQLAAGTELDFDIALETDRAELPPVQLGGEGKAYQPLLGWNTCLHAPTRRASGPVDIVIGQSL